jgi:hypothetical protein
VILLPARHGGLQRNPLHHSLDRLLHVSCWTPAQKARLWQEITQQRLTEPANVDVRSLGDSDIPQQLLTEPVRCRVTVDQLPIDVLPHDILLPHM